MAQSVILEDFSAPIAPPVPKPTAAPEADDATMEQKIAASYEKGFKAGWDDCKATMQNDQSLIAEAFGRRLGELTLIRDDIRTKLLTEIHPLFEDILQKILPRVVQHAFLPRIVEEIQHASSEIGAGPFVIAVCEEDAPALQNMLETVSDLPAVEVVTDPALGLSQAFISLGQSKRKLDLSGIMDAVETAFAEFSDQDKKLGSSYG